MGPGVPGGITGGSCWGGEPNEPRNADREEDFAGLTAVLEALCPSISFLKYRKLEKDLVKIESTSNDYYGNYSNYSEKFLYLEDLYNFLVTEGLI